MADKRSKRDMKDQLRKNVKKFLAPLREKYVGQSFWLNDVRRDGKATGLSFLVRCLDVRTRFGRIDMLVTPLEGRGEKWVSTSRLVPAETWSDPLR